MVKILPQSKASGNELGNFHVPSKHELSHVTRYYFLKSPFPTFFRNVWTDFNATSQLWHKSLTSEKPSASHANLRVQKANQPLHGLCGLRPALTFPSKSSMPLSTRVIEPLIKENFPYTIKLCLLLMGNMTACVGHTQHMWDTWGKVWTRKNSNTHPKRKKIRKGQISLGHYFLSPIHSLPH